MELKVCALDFLVIAKILVLASSVVGSNSCNFPAIFNFGDSNSDTGGFSAAFTKLLPMEKHSSTPLPAVTAMAVSS
ncbi:hypothetical protein OROMI_022078 [Orobanche minor]